jgi:hypothetical protein
MHRWMLWTIISVGAVLIVAFAGLSVMAGSPKDAVQMVRYALPHMRLGSLKAGDSAPDVQLVALDGTTRFQLHERAAGRPLVLVFGSFT